MGCILSSKENTDAIPPKTSSVVEEDPEEVINIFISPVLSMTFSFGLFSSTIFSLIHQESWILLVSCGSQAPLAVVGEILQAVQYSVLLCLSSKLRY